VSVRLAEPQFEGQTKGKLGNVAIRSLVERATNEKLADWLEENPKEGGQIVAKSLQAARAVKRRATRAISRDARARSTAPDSRASSSTVRPTNRASANCSSSRATRPEGRRRTRAIRASRRSCRFEARS